MPILPFMIPFPAYLIFLAILQFSPMLPAPESHTRRFATIQYSVRMRQPIKGALPRGKPQLLAMCKGYTITLLVPLNHYSRAPFPALFRLLNKIAQLVHGQLMGFLLPLALAVHGHSIPNQLHCKGEIRIVARSGQTTTHVALGGGYPYRHGRHIRAAFLEGRPG